MEFKESHVYSNNGYAPVSGIECAVKETFLKTREMVTTRTVIITALMQIFLDGIILEASIL